MIKNRKRLFFAYFVIAGLFMAYCFEGKAFTSPVNLMGVCGPDSLTKGKTDSAFICAIPDEAPQFPGGFNAYKEYVKTHLHYPETAVEASIMGKVYISFTVQADGSLTGVHIRKDNLGYGCGEEALKMIEGMPKWIPGKFCGKPTPVKYTVPVDFTLN